MSDDELREKVKTVSIFSRVIPEHKMRIVKAFKENGEIVAMTGDGVNDAPALKYSDIGIAMGKRGSEVSREAADLILLDDNFTTIVETVKDLSLIHILYFFPSFLFLHGKEAVRLLHKNKSCRSLYIHRRQNPLSVLYTKKHFYHIHQNQKDLFRN